MRPLSLETISFSASTLLLFSDSSRLAARVFVRVCSEWR